MKAKSLSTINFVYFLTNFPMGFNEIIRTVWADDKLLADHFVNKMAGILANQYPNAGGIKPGAIISFLFELSDDKKAKFIEWVEQNYHYSDSHKNQPWEVSVPIPNQTIKDILITALEGGSNYWYYLRDLDMVRKHFDQTQSLSLSEKIGIAVLDHGETIPVYDYEDELQKLGEISRENIERGLKLFLPDNMLDAGMDAFEADSLFQLIVMGEIVYG